MPVSALSSPATMPSVAPSSRAVWTLAAERSMATIRAAFEHRSRDDRQPDAAEPDDGDAGTRRHLGCLEDCANASRHAAPDERSDRRIDAVGERDRCRFRHDSRLRHRADPAGADRLPAVRGEDGRAVGHPMGERRGVRTGPRVAAATGATLARTAQSQDRATGWPTRSCPTSGPTASTTPRTPLVAHHDGGRPRPVAIADVQVGVDDARCQDPDADLAGSRLRQLEHLDVAGRAARSQDRRRDGGHGRAIVAGRRRSPRGGSRSA